MDTTRFYTINQRNKDETIVSAIKKLFGEHITSILVRMQNRELMFRCIVYYVHRIVNLLVIVKYFLRSIFILGFIITDNEISIKYWNIDYTSIFDDINNYG